MLGLGIIKGFIVTAKNFVGSYVTRERMTTVEYPEKRIPIPDAFRSFPFLVYDGDNAIDGLRCVACKICEKECPPQCIYIVPERDEKGKVMKQPRVFDIDYSVCMGCQICVEACPFDSIKMDHHYEIATRDRYDGPGGLLMHREQLSKPNSYFHKINPTDAHEVDTRLAEEKRVSEEKAKAAAAAKVAAAADAAAKAAAGSSGTGVPPVGSGGMADPAMSSEHGRVARATQPAKPETK